MIIKNNTTNLLNFFKNYITISNGVKTKSHKLKILSTHIHKKLMYIRFYYKKKYYNYSFGQILNNFKKIKYFKKSYKSLGLSINFLSKILKKNIKNIYIYYCKNFCYKNYLWFKKFYFMLNPNINYFIISKSWNYITKNKKRIKRRILRNLIKQTYN